MDSDSSDDDDDPFRFCTEYLHGIKKSKIWKTPKLDRTKSTYFVLPRTPAQFRVIEFYITQPVLGLSLGGIKPTREGFANFWFELSDLHKDRYLLVNYMATMGAIDNENREMEAFVTRDRAAAQVNGLWVEMTSKTSHLLRGLIVEKNKEQFLRDGGALSLFVSCDPVDRLFDLLRPQLTLIMRSITQRMEMIRSLPHWRMQVLKESSLHQFNMWICSMISRVISGFVNTYFVWVSYDAQNLRRYAMELRRRGESVPIGSLNGNSRLEDQIEFMRKLKAAAPRWSQSDRRMMLDAIESNGKSCRGTYVQILLNEVGVEKFKVLVFGKQHFCAHCRRSSYTGEDRMLACKRCDTEGVRPRAWYCDRECQKADWRQHKVSKHPAIMVEKKAITHPTVVVEDETNKHPSAEEEKKAIKKKKRKPRKK